MVSAQNASLDALHDLDLDRYLACLYLPEELRRDASAIYAFGTETARIAELVSEPLPGEIRLQWWREVISLSREHGNNQVAAELLAAIDKHNLPRQTFLACLDARVFDLYSDPMPNKATLEAYCGETTSALMNLIALCASASPGRELADACGHAGVAIAVTQLLKVTAAFRVRQRIYVPQDILTAAGLTAESWLSEEPDERHLNTIAIMLGFARDHYASAIDAINKLDKSLRHLFILLAVVPVTLNVIEKAGKDLFHNVPEPGQLRRQWSMWRAGIFGFKAM
ncbi:MAG: phytoene/squalene synthase family protein [Pseudomonadota bacterium]